MKNVDYREEFYLKIFHQFPLGFDILHKGTITKNQTPFAFYKWTTCPF